MSPNIEIIVGIITAILNAKFKNVLPNIDEIESEAQVVRINNANVFPLSDDEYHKVVKVLKGNILHSIGNAHSLKGKDATHQSWYPVHENDSFYWNRYKKYLEMHKKWSPEFVRRLHETTNLILDDLGDPTNTTKRFQRRGLLLGDVQSGKTATYTAICNKAADCGYKVIIILAGLMENLRVQTQERLDAEFVGVESKYSLDPKADNAIKNMPVGVGTIGPFIPEKRIARFTSVSIDFNKTVLKSNNLTLKNLNGTALFVVKKHKSILNNLHQWLLENNADLNNSIDFPLLLIDDEADNASVNTNSEEKNPTAINTAIRNILASFERASYLGITATPFANIFIDPLTKEGKTDDLFPKHFLTVLPSPDHYIGAEAIFGSGDDEDWHIRNNAPYGESIIKIFNEEQKDFFIFKHKKGLVDSLSDLPPSLYEAMNYFLLATAISDMREDITEHRSMLVNVSYLTDVQNRIAELIEIWLKQVVSDLENYSLLDIQKALKINSIKELKGVWDKHTLEACAACHWEVFLKEYLFKAAKRIEVRAVNKDSGAASLNYYAYKNIGMRVIAVGGNSLSRGLTLEGLCVSYFYRNTMMYDTLLQMGRWFGYRNNYDDLFKIWMAEDAVDYYGYITDATIELKQELKLMERQHQTPEEFGLKVRQDPNSLIVTARNKMRTATSVSRPITVSGRLLETPRLKNRSYSLQGNEKICRDFIRSIDGIEGVSRELNDSPRAVLWRNIPKKVVVELVKGFDTHPWHLNFQSQALSEYIETSEDLLLWDVAVPFGSITEKFPLKLFDESIDVFPEEHFIKEKHDMLMVSGTHVKVGAGSSTRLGLSSCKIVSLKKEAKSRDEKISDKTYLIKDRKPILMIHIIKTKAENEANPLDKCPEFLFALGLGFPSTGKKEKTANYLVNINELKNWMDIEDLEDFEDDDNDDL